MARFLTIYIAFLIAFIAAVVDSASTKTPKTSPEPNDLISKLNQFAHYVDRGFKSVVSSVRTLKKELDRDRNRIPAFNFDNLTSSILVLESLDAALKSSEQTTTMPENAGYTRTPTPTKIRTRGESTLTFQQDTTTELSTTVSAPTTSKAPECRDGWIKYNSSCFEFNRCPDGCSYFKAMEVCRASRSHLAKCSSLQQQKFFIDSLNPSFYIILGGNDLVHEGTWRWSDGSLMKDGFTNWAPGKPNGGHSHDCMRLFTQTRKWSDDQCDHRFSKYNSAGFVCELPLTGS